MASRPPVRTVRALPKCYLALAGVAGFALSAALFLLLG